MQSQLYRFNGAEFDAGTGALVHDGHVARLRPRTAAVLLHLLQRAGEVVSKDELLRAVWKDLVVTENSLSQCVKEIRRELADFDEHVLKTIHRRGYALEASVESVAHDPGTVRPHRLSLMVMPLVNLGGDPDHDYFAEGLTEDLTMDLGRMPEAFVIARGTAQFYADRRVDARRIGHELGVRYLVEGSVRRSAREIAVNLNVCETSDARQVWAERLTAERTNLLALQRAMAGKVAHMLHFDLFNLESEETVGRDVDAHDLAMRAFALKVRTLPNVSPEVGRLVQRAIDLDPNCAYAWTVLAEMHVVALATRNFDDWRATAMAAEGAARKALEIDPGQRVANTALGSALCYLGRFEEAMGAFERQLALIPNLANAHNWMGLTHTLMGNGQKAIPCHEAAIELSPRDHRLSTWYRALALACMHEGNDARALIEAERSVAVAKPWPRSYEALAMAYAVNGLGEEASAAARVLLHHWPDYSIAQHRAEMMSSRPAFVAQRERLLHGLRDAGVPEI